MPEQRGPARPEAEESIRRTARIVGLRGLEVPTLEDVEQRRLQLWIVMSVVLLAVAAAMVAVSVWTQGDEVDVWLFEFSPLASRIGILALVGGFCAYAIEKELNLRRLTRLLLEERVLVTALSNRLKELSSLLDAGRAMNSVLDLNEVLNRILENALELLDADNGSVMLAEGTDRLRAVAVSGNDAAVDVVIGVGEGIAGRVAATWEPLLITGEVDASAFPGRRVRRKPVRSAMSVPLIHRDELLGVLNVNAGSDREFTEYDLRALSLFGEHAAGAIANARLYEAERAQSAVLAHQAHHDPLTNLANRTLFAQRVGEAVARARITGSRLAVLFLDLDEFKRVNDSLGHVVGDKLLCAVADRLRRCLRDNDTPARLGGDEFAVLIEDLDDAADALATAERLVQQFNAPFAVAERTLSARVSIGVVVADADADVDADDLLRNADVAMYIAKAQGKGCARVFEPGMHRAVIERLELESQLERAVENAELVLHYQPVFDLVEDELIGFEALVRWNHPERGLLAPDAFIPLAEETGLIVGIDRWVLLHACCQARAWQEAYQGEQPLLVGVNLSTRQLEHDSVVELVALALEISGLPPASLVLELTESFLIEDEDAGARRLEALRALGVRLAIDDFGTGYASLSYLKRLPVDVLKIDRSFIDGLGRTPEDAALVRAVTRLASSLGLDAVAEGVERAEQVEALQALGCQYAQGWHFARPLVADDLEALLRARFEAQPATT